MSDDDDAFTIENLWTNLIIPIWKDAISSSLERFSRWKHFWMKIIVPSVKPWMPFITTVKIRWWNIIAAPPLHDLIFAVLLRCFRFVKTLQSSIMSFIKPPRFVVREPNLIQFCYNREISLDCAG